jgi:hypothetical protein
MFLLSRFGLGLRNVPLLLSLTGNNIGGISGGLKTQTGFYCNIWSLLKNFENVSMAVHYVHIFFINFILF